MLNARKSAVERVGKGFVRSCLGEFAEHLRKTVQHALIALIARMQESA